jgi:Na+:H+ antiporter, NhaA family
MPRRLRVSRDTLPQLWHFLREHLLGLPIGAAIALVWVNVQPERYYSFAYAIAFAVNDVAMAFFFALMMKEVVEATAPGGVLHPFRRALFPVVAAVGGALLPALLHVFIVEGLDEPALRIAWPIALAADLAVCYFVARIIFGKHPVIPFVILIGIACDAIAFMAIALFHPTEDLRLGRGAVIFAGALLLALMLRRARVRSFWPYLLGPGAASWYAFFTSGLHPALALVPIMPFLPHAGRDPGFFVDASPDARDTLNRFELWWRHPAQIALFFFGLVNAGVSFHALEPGTWGLPAAVIVGRPLGILLGAGLALAVGLHLPERLGWRELVVVGFTVAIGFSVGLFACAALLPPGQLLDESRMGVLLTLAGAPLAFLAARLLRVGRFAAPVTR